MPTAAAPPKEMRNEVASDGMASDCMFFPSLLNRGSAGPAHILPPRYARGVKPRGKFFLKFVPPTLAADCPDGTWPSSKLLISETFESEVLGVQLPEVGRFVKRSLCIVPRRYQDVQPEYALPTASIPTFHSPVRLRYTPYLRQRDLAAGGRRDAQSLLVAFWSQQCFYAALVQLGSVIDDRGV